MNFLTLGKLFLFQWLLCLCVVAAPIPFSKRVVNEPSTEKRALTLPSNATFGWDDVAVEFDAIGKELQKSVCENMPDFCTKWNVTDINSLGVGLFTAVDFNGLWSNVSAAQDLNDGLAKMQAWWQNVACQFNSGSCTSKSARSVSDQWLDRARTVRDLSRLVLSSRKVVTAVERSIQRGTCKFDSESEYCKTAPYLITPRALWSAAKFARDPSASIWDNSWLDSFTNSSILAGNAVQADVCGKAPDFCTKWNVTDISSLGTALTSAADFGGLWTSVSQATDLNSFIAGVQAWWQKVDCQLDATSCSSLVTPRDVWTTFSRINERGLKAAPVSSRGFGDDVTAWFKKLPCQFGSKAESCQKTNLSSSL